VATGAVIIKRRPPEKKSEERPRSSPSPRGATEFAAAQIVLA